MSEQGEQLTSIVPDFFADLIGRIVPGFVVITLSLYFSGNDLKAAFSTFGLSVFVLAAAWIIGVTLDVGVYCILKGPCADKLLKLKPFPDDPHNCHWDYLCNTNTWERGIINKARALSVFFRNMLFICALTALACVIAEFVSCLNSLLPLLYSHRWRYVFLALFFSRVFYLCWIEQRNWLVNECNRSISKGGKDQPTARPPSPTC